MADILETTLALLIHYCNENGCTCLPTHICSKYIDVFIDNMGSGCTHPAASMSSGKQRYIWYRCWSKFVTDVRLCINVVICVRRLVEHTYTFPAKCYFTSKHPVSIYSIIHISIELLSNIYSGPYYSLTTCLYIIRSKDHNYASRFKHCPDRDIPQIWLPSSSFQWYIVDK